MSTRSATLISAFATCTPSNQQLLGFGAHDAISEGGGYLGAVDLQDPVTLMADGLL